MSAPPLHPSMLPAFLVRHEKLFEIIQRLDIDDKDIQLLQNLHWEQSAAIRIDNEFSKCVLIKIGVRQGCVLSPDMFNVITLREIDILLRVVVGGQNVNNLRYADDTALIAYSKDKPELLLATVVARSEDLVFRSNVKRLTV